ncbi:TPR-like protein [Lizonia empirigonia]|nr:TPR-like protein [Lizonia empirigonia]
MLGIFGVYLPLIYGEGYESALLRLQEAIARSQGGIVDQDTKVKRVPSSTVPFPRDDDFITRDNLDAVCLLCARPRGRAALVGLGGVGKSQIAIEYTYRVLDESPETWVFWIHAETHERFREGYRKIADAIKMDGWNDPDPNVVMRLVRTWLCDKSNGKWLMVVDNVDDGSVFFQVTSRSRDVAYRLTGATHSIVEVVPMSDKEALALLQKKFDFVVKNNEADTLIRALDAMPLALTQATAFINIRAPLMSISKYLDEVCRSDQDRVRLLNEDSGDTRRDGRASSSIIRTWQISFEYIRKRWPTAAQLLSLMSLFNRQIIPDTLLCGRYGGNGDESVDFENDVYTLTSFSLIKPNVNGTSFDMHDLVQLSTKKWLALSDELEYWKEIYVTLIDDSCLVGRPEDWLICRELFPHVQAALDNHPFGADALETWASVAHKASRYVAGIGEYTQAHKLALDALGVREELLGPEHLETLDSLNSLGMALGRLGRYDEAKKLHQKALEAKERTLGAESDDTLTSYWTEAETLLKQILEVASKIEVGAEGHMHDVKLYTLISLATAYENLGRWEDAIEMKTQVLATREAQLGPDHPKTLNVKVQLAYAYGENGRLTEAEKLFLEVLRAQESNGAAERDILIAKGHLATVYRMQAITYRTQGRFEEARDLQLEVLSLHTTHLGEQHSSTLDIKTCLATTYWSMELFAESTALTLDVLESRTATLGPEHLLTVNSKADLAFSHHDQGRFGEASQLLEVVLSVRSEKLGKEHPMTLECMGNLAVTYYRQGKMESALETMEKCHEAHERCVGKEHPNTVRYKEKLET